MKNILIIDDEKFFYEEVRSSKYSKNFILSYVDRFEDVDKIKIKPDLVLLDFVLQTNNSFDLKLKEALINKWPDLIVIYVSSFFKEELNEIDESELFINKSKFSFRSMIRICGWEDELPL